MPQAARRFTSHRDGGAIVLPQRTHSQTRTYGSRGVRTARDERNLDFRTTLARDIRDVRRISGSTYNSGLRGVIDYYRAQHPLLIRRPTIL